MKDSMEDAKNTKNVGKQKALLQFAKDGFFFLFYRRRYGWKYTGVSRISPVISPFFPGGNQDFGGLDPRIVEICRGFL